MTSTTHQKMLCAAHRLTDERPEEAYHTVIGLLLLALATPVGAVVLLPAAYALVTGSLPVAPQ
jgi:multisubunit Na+/H+ antiporter MnhG subunit